MLETLFFATLIFLFLNRSKKKRRPRSLDGELKELIATDQENKGIALEIKNYLLWIIDSNNNDEEKFNDLQLTKAQEIIDRAGPAAFYWMSDIAAQLALLSAAQINGIPTNVNVEQWRKGCHTNSEDNCYGLTQTRPYCDYHGYTNPHSCIY
jgi:hypothetical protein